jgi:rhodanese-related sulfurtransferase
MPYTLPDVPEITVADLVREIAAGGMQIVDVREDDEWQAGRIPASIHIPLGQVSARSAELNPDEPVVAICHSGVRSLYAVDILQKAGFSEARSLTGGIVAWVEAGQPLTL